MRRLTHGVVLVVIGAGAIVAALVTFNHRGYHTPSDAGILPAASSPQSQQPATQPDAPVVTSPTTTSHTGTTRPGRPLSVAISNIDVNARVLPVTVHRGALDVPEDPQQLGWWSKGARPGAAQGSVVVVGHVDSAVSGRGALFHLESVAMGSRVAVKTTHGTVTYRVVARRVYKKQVLPSSVFATNGPARLVLITCGGPFNSVTRHYADNVVVYAVPVST